MINLQNIQKTYQTGATAVHALRSINLEFKTGEMAAIVGASGSGKSTLMNIVGCLDQASSGTYTLDGFEVAQLNDDKLAELRSQKIGFVFQSFNLLPRTSAIENVLLPFLYAARPPADSTERAMKALEAVGLADRLLHKPNQLSGGQQQRVAIARALINDPALILADEPTGALDTRSGLEIMELLQKLHAEGRTIVIVTHEREIAEHCQRIITLADGQVVKDEKVVNPLRAESALRQLPKEVAAS